LLDSKTARLNYWAFIELIIFLLVEILDVIYFILHYHLPVQLLLILVRSRIRLRKSADVHENSQVLHTVLDPFLALAPGLLGAHSFK
jgi:hypothetical protein